MARTGRPQNSAGSMYGRGNSKKDIENTAISSTRVHTVQSHPVHSVYGVGQRHGHDVFYNVVDHTDEPWHRRLGMTLTPATTYYDVKAHYNRQLLKHPEKREYYKQAWKNFRKQGLHVPRNHAVLSRALQSTHPTQHKHLVQQYRDGHNRFARGTVQKPPYIPHFKNTRAYRDLESRWNRRKPRRGTMQHDAYTRAQQAYKKEREAAFDKAHHHHYMKQGPHVLRKHLVQYIETAYEAFRKIHRTSLSIYIRQLVYQNIDSVTHSTIEYVSKETSYADSIVGSVVKFVQSICPFRIPGGALVNVLFSASKFAVDRILAIQGREIYEKSVMSTEQLVSDKLRQLMHTNPTNENIFGRLAHSIVTISKTFRHVSSNRICSALTKANLYFVDAMISQQLRYSLGIRVNGSMFRKVIETHASTIFDILAGHTVDAKILQMMKDTFQAKDSTGHYLVSDHDVAVVYRQLHPYLL